jgi:hypothetical protein
VERTHGQGEDLRGARVQDRAPGVPLSAVLLEAPHSRDGVWALVSHSGSPHKRAELLSP